MSEEHLEIVRAMYDAWGSGDFGAGAADLDADVVFIVRPSLPEPGVSHGTDEVRNYMRRFLSMWERYTLEAEELRVVGDTVIAGIRQRGVGKASGIETDVRSYMLFTFRGRKIVRIESMLHRERGRRSRWAGGLGRATVGRLAGPTESVRVGAYPQRTASVVRRSRQDGHAARVS